MATGMQRQIHQAKLFLFRRSSRQQSVPGPSRTIARAPDEAPVRRRIGAASLGVAAHHVACQSACEVGPTLLEGIVQPTDQLKDAAHARNGRYFFGAEALRSPAMVPASKPLIGTNSPR